MSIKIKGSPNKLQRASESKVSSSGKKSSAAPSKGKGNTSSDSVDLTDTASKLQQLEQSLADIPIVDSSRIEAVSQSIDDGQYQINNEKIADRIISSENEINNKNKKS